MLQKSLNKPFQLPSIILLIYQMFSGMLSLFLKRLRIFPVLLLNAVSQNHLDFQTCRQSQSARIYFYCSLISHFPLHPLSSKNLCVLLEFIPKPCFLQEKQFLICCCCVQKTLKLEAVISDTYIFRLENQFLASVLRETGLKNLNQFSYFIASEAWLISYSLNTKSITKTKQAVVPPKPYPIIVSKGKKQDKFVICFLLLI